MSSESESIDDLPTGWRICASKSKPGSKFYFNPNSGQSVWATPKITREVLLQMERQYDKCHKQLQIEKGLKRKSDGAPKENIAKMPKIDLNQITKEPQTPVCIKNNTTVKYDAVPVKKTSDKNLASKRLAFLRAKLQAETKIASQAEVNKTNVSVKKNPTQLHSDNFNRNNNKTSKAQIKKSLNDILNNISKSKGAHKNITRNTNKKCCNKNKKALLELHEIKTPGTSGVNNTPTHSKTTEVIKTKTKDVKSFTAILTPNKGIDAPKVNTEPKTVIVKSINAESRKIKTEPRNIRSNPYSIQRELPRELKFNKIKEVEKNIELKNVNIVAPIIYSTPKSIKTNEINSLNKSNLHRGTPSSEIKLYASAKDRLAAFRSQISETKSDSSSTEEMVISGTVTNDTDSITDKSLSNINDSGINILDSTVNCNREEDRSMDVDVPVEPEPLAVVSNKADISENKLVLVVDTNLFIHDLNGIKEILNCSIKGYKELPTLMVPWRVLNELDGLKEVSRSADVSARARRAMDFLYKSLPENNRIKGQTLREAHTHVYPCEIADDEILNCCFQQTNLGHSVILISNDKNLCTKAAVNGIRSCSIAALLSDFVSDDVSTLLDDKLRRYQKYLYDLLANIMENEMRIKFNNLWQHLLYKVPPWTLKDVVCSILQNWIAVFSEVFPVKKMESDMKNLKNLLTTIDCKGGKEIKQIELDNFKKIANEIATTCQIIPEYMNLAKVTLEKLNGNEDCNKSNQDTANSNAYVIEAFERVWTVFSSYCARLTEVLGISHDLDIKVNLEESCNDVQENIKLYSTLIQQFTLALKGILEVQSDDPECQQQIVSLECVFNSSLAAVNANCRLDDTKLKIFCFNNRNMLLEAYTKFSQLSKLMLQCDNHVDK